MLNPFPHTKTLQQTTLKTSAQKYEKSIIMKEYSFDIVVNIVAKGEIVVCCSDVRNCMYVGKG